MLDGSMLTTLAIFVISQLRMASSVGGSVLGATFRFFNIQDPSAPFYADFWLRSTSGCFFRAIFTAEASPSMAHSLIMEPVMSTCHHSNPCTAELGNAWWLLCHDSPNVGIARTTLLVLWSFTWYVWLPKTWQTELMLHVVWCTTNIRMSPPHRNPRANPSQLMVIRPSAVAGNNNPSTIQRKYRRFSLKISLSCNRSRTYVPQSVSSWLKSQPMCECHKPFAVSTTPSPCRCGE